MTEKERIETLILKYQLLVNFLTFTTMEKTIQNDALGMRIRTEVKDLMEKELRHGAEQVYLAPLGA